MSSSSPTPDDRIDEAIDWLETVYSSSTKPDRSKVQDTLSDLSDLVDEHGFNSQQVARVVSVAMGGRMDDGLSSRAIKLILPRTMMDEDVVLAVLGGLGSSPDEKGKGKRRERADVKVQATALRFLVLLLAPNPPMLTARARRALERLYGVLFHHIEYQTLRPHLCHLLARLTRRHHVKHFRISRLIAMRAKLGDDPSISGLLGVYSDFYPSLVLPEVVARGGGGGKAVTGVGLERRLAAFKYPDREWLEKAREIQNPEGRRGGDEEENPGGRAAKRSKRMHVAIPRPYTLNASESSTLVTEMTGLQNLARRMDKLELPSQLASVLDDRFVRHLILTDPQESHLARIGNWILSVLMDEFENARSSSRLTHARVDEFLGRVIAFCRSSRETLPDLEWFLADLFRTWDGRSHHERIFDLLALHRPTGDKVFLDRILGPLQKLAQTASPEWKADLLWSLTRMLRNWTTANWVKILSAKEQGKPTPITFSSWPADVDYVRCLDSVVRHVDRMAESMLNDNHTSILLHHAALAFYEAVAPLPGLHRTLVPSATAVLVSVLQPSVMPISRMSGALLSLRTAFEANEVTAPSKERSLADVRAELFSRKNKDLLNAYVIAMCDLLWRGKALASLEAGAAEIGVPPRVLVKLRQQAEGRGDSWGHFGSVTHGAAFAALATKSLEHQCVEAGAKPPRVAPGVTAATLKEVRDAGGPSIPYPAFRSALLDYLAARGAEGLDAFLAATMSSLAKSRGRRSST